MSTAGQHHVLARPHAKLRRLATDLVAIADRAFTRRWCGDAGKLPPPTASSADRSASGAASSADAARFVEKLSQSSIQVCVICFCSMGSALLAMPLRAAAHLLAG